MRGPSARSRTGVPRCRPGLASRRARAGYRRDRVPRRHPSAPGAGHIEFANDQAFELRGEGRDDRMHVEDRLVEAGRSRRTLSARNAGHSRSHRFRGLEEDGVRIAGRSSLRGSNRPRASSARRGASHRADRRRLRRRARCASGWAWPRPRPRRPCAAPERVLHAGMRALGCERLAGTERVLLHDYDDVAARPQGCAAQSPAMPPPMTRASRSIVRCMRTLAARECGGRCLP